MLVLRTALAEVNGLQADGREHADDDPHDEGDGHQPEHLRHRQADEHEVADRAQHMAKAGCQDHLLGSAGHAGAKGRKRRRMRCHGVRRMAASAVCESRER